LRRWSEMGTGIARREFMRRTVLAGAGVAALPAALAGCGGGGESAPEPGEKVKLRVWAQAAETEFWRARGPARAAKKVEEYKVSVDPTNDSADWEDYKRKYALAADAGEGPDIVLSGHEDVAVWSRAEYVVPFDEYREQYSEFDDVIETLWDSVSFDGQLWGVPQDTEARPMYYSKKKLAELGWSQEEIDSLPDRIRDGEFTLDDMIGTARQAVDEGVVKRGYGYWHRTEEGGDFLQYYAAYGGRLYDGGKKKLVVVRDALVEWYAFQRRVVEEEITPKNYIGTDSEVWHDTVSHGNALFFNGGIWNWSDWAQNYVADLGGQDYLFENIGYALQPNGRSGEQGLTLSHPLVYMISSESASNASNQDVSAAVLAKTTTPEINTLHAVESTHLGILKSQQDYPKYENNRLLSETLYMLDYNFYQPNHAMYGPYFTALWNSMVRAENGEASPEKAADEAIRLMKSEIPDEVIFE
jgi:inositol-phosphate transport system substrate-binding protein